MKQNISHSAESLPKYQPDLPAVVPTPSIAGSIYRAKEMANG